ncbi:putative deoxyribonuclease YabD [Geobacter sp. OR-1]|nr:putative deoxyribonuclease YabD [Geobacter sp. OR-1]
MNEFSETSHPLVDTHCHLDDPRLSGRLDKLFSDAGKAGISRYIVPGVDPENWGRIEKIASGYRAVFTAFGVHPFFAAKWSSTVRDELTTLLPKAVAIGEIGLDYSCKEVSRHDQINAFRQQLQVAVSARLPVLIHCRGAFKDMLDILREESVSAVGGIMHAFSGSPEVAMECIRHGLLISIAGPVTYSNAVHPVKLVERLPLSHLVLETDAPDMTPELYKGVDNEPAFLPVIAAAVAKIKGISYDELADITTNNANKIFGVKT